MNNLDINVFGNLMQNVINYLNQSFMNLTQPSSHEWLHNIDVIMTAIAFQITSLTVVYSTVYSDADKKTQQSSVSLAFVWGIHRDRGIPRTKDKLRGKCFLFMTSSWPDSTRCDTTRNHHMTVISLLVAWRKYEITPMCISKINLLYTKILFLSPRMSGETVHLY